MKGLHGFVLNWNLLNFLGVYKKKTCKKKKVGKNCFGEQKNPEHILKFSRKNTNISKPSEPFWAI